MAEIYLGIDTSTPYLVLGLWSSEAGLLGQLTEEAGRAHAARLVPAVADLLAQAGTERNELTALCAGTGPGSYTGIRVAGAAGKGLASALGIPLYGCDTLAAIAATRLGGEHLQVVAALDARRGNVYAGRYGLEHDTVSVLEEPRKLPREEAVQGLNGALLLEDLPPDAGYLARSAAGRRPYLPLYL